MYVIRSEVYYAWFLFFFQALPQEIFITGREAFDLIQSETFEQVFLSLNYGPFQKQSIFLLKNKQKAGWYYIFLFAPLNSTKVSREGKQLWRHQLLQFCVSASGLTPEKDFPELSALQHKALQSHPFLLPISWHVS